MPLKIIVMNYAFDCYADTSGEVVEIVYRKVANEEYLEWFGVE